jgi:peptidoglycan-associated lipoprotein
VATAREGGGSPVRQFSTLPVGWMILLVIVSLALAGCPKPPSIGQPGESPAGAGSSAAGPAPPGPSGPSAGGEPSVSRPTLPAETPIGSAKGPGAGQAGPGGTGTSGAAAGSPAGAAGASPLKDIYFDYDRSTILEDQKAILNQDAAWLKANPAVKVTIEGHCDERGGTEYNLGLGERRARAVKEYLAAAGIAADRLATISYGKERPLVLGHDENAWKWNRRVHFTMAAR